MKPKILKFALAALVSAALTLSFTACNDGGGSSAKAGPGSAASFAGSSVTFNPTVNFLAGNAITYINTEAGSPFPAAATATNGTYTYVPNANFTAGTLTLTIDGVTDPVVLEIGNFRRNGANVTGFTARVGNVNYPVTVTGTLAAHTPSGGGGSTTGESRADDIPSAWRGSHALTFERGSHGAAPIAGVPADGTKTTFTLGARTLSFNGKTLSNPIWYAGNKYEYIFKDGNIWWAVSGSDTALNEINVQGPYTGTGNVFYGQYHDKDNPASGGAYNSIGIGQNGAYVGGGFTANVTNVVGPTTMPSGSHLAVQDLDNGQTVSFTFSNNGDLTSPDLVGTFVYGGSDAVSVTYNQIRPTDSPAVADTITIHKATATGLPGSLSISSTRNQATPSVKTTTATYTLEVNIP